MSNEEISPGIFVSADDAYLPIWHQAFDLANKLHNRNFIEIKKVKLVRTVSGMRRYQQDKGAIIIKDGAPPLDALTGVVNDIQGYEKLADKNGNFYYIGQENGRFAVRNPKDNSLMFETPNEDDAYNWLNKKVGGGDQPASDRPGPFDNLPTNKPGDSAQRNAVRDELSSTTQDGGRLGRGYDLNVAEASAIDTLTDAEIEKYKEQRARGLTHREAYRLSQSQGLSGSPQARAARAKEKKK